MVRAKRKREIISDPITDELLSSDIWNNDLCTVCQVEMPERQLKIGHAKSPKHAKKVSIFKFLTEDASSLSVTGRPSKLMERYKDKGCEAIGIDCIHELVFPFAASGWWACSLCYESGFNFEQVDEHLNSSKHLQNFMDEFHPAKAKKMDKDWSQTERLDYLLAMKKQIYYEETQKGADLASPEIIDLPSWTLEMARKRLVIDETRKDYTVIKMAEESGNVMIQCQICHEVLPCCKDKVEQAWTRHTDTERHKRLKTLNAILRQYHFELVQEEDRMLIELAEDTEQWKHVDDRVYGPVCGIKHLRRMGSTCICSLCGVVADEVDEHFASEHHLIRFACTRSPRDAWQMMQTSQETRREKLLAMIQKGERENEESSATPEECPSRLTWYAVESESEQLPSTPPVEPLGLNSSCLFCQCCWLSLPVPAGQEPDAVWNEHVVTSEHFDFAARRYTIDYDDAYLVPLASSVQLLPKDPHGQWITESVGEQVMWKYQTQTDVGLEYVVEDADLELAVCTLCARSYALGEHCQMGRHVRSLQHLMQYLHVSNRTMLSMVLDMKKEADSDELLLEFLVRNSVSGIDEIRVFNKKKTKDLESWPAIKIRTMQISSFTPEIRPVYDCLLKVVDDLAEDEEEQRTLSAREALHSAGMKEIRVTKPFLIRTGLSVFRCGACELCFVVTPAQVEHDVWEKHLGSEEHLRRTIILAQFKFAPLFFTPLSSTYTVKPFVQKDPTKKVTWRWNPKEKSHDLVLTVVGLDELVEKKSDESMIVDGHDEDDYTAHFFCRVCAVVVGRRAQMLEDHVRSATHVYAYVNKHFPQTVLELERLDNNDGGKERRRIIATLLKDIKPPTEYCIPVYDPIGESERRQKEAEVKHKQREAMIKNEEMRQKAMAERKKMDEEKRKWKEEETKKEKKREEERKQRETALFEKAAAISAERERLRKFAMEKAALAEIARKKDERAQAQAQLTRDPAIAKLLSERQAISAQLEALRAAKAAIPEPRLLIPGPNQLASAPPKPTAAAPTPDVQILPPVRITGAPGPVPAFMPPPGMGMPPPGMFPLPPPGMGMGMGPPPPLGPLGIPQFGMPPASLMGGMPPPGMGIPPLMSVPPPSLMGMSVPPLGLMSAPPPGVMDMVGPKPVISTFVPKVDAMPVYPTQQGPASAALLRRADFERPSLARATADLYATNPAIITNRQALVDYMWKQGNEETPEGERPARFSRLCAATPACLGMEYIYEVVCLDSGDLTTMYCSMCGYWSTPSDTVKHMLTPAHRLLYLFRNYKLYHKTVESEVDQRAKEILLEQFAMQIRSRDNPPPCVTHRLKCYLNVGTIQRLWPQYVTVLDQSWRTNPVCRTPSPTPARRGRSRSYSSDSRSRSYSRSRSPSPKERNRRSRSRDHHSRRRRSVSRSRSRSRSPRRGRDGRRRSYSRSRSGTPTNKMSGSNGSNSMGGIPAFNTSLPPPMFGSMSNMGVPPPGLVNPSALPPKPTVPATVDDDDCMMISTTPPPAEKKKEEKRGEKEKGRDREKHKEKESKSSTPRKNRSRSRERSSRRDSGKKEKKEEKDPVREEQRKKAFERAKELDREKREQREKEKRDRRDRKRSPSPSRKRRRSDSRERRRSDSRERRSSHRSSTGGGHEENGDWTSMAAAFLTRIGDLQGASKLIQPGVAASASPYSGSAPPVYAGAPAAARPGSGMGGASYEPVAASPRDFGETQAKRQKAETSPEYEPLMEECAPSSAAAAAAAVPDDDETTKRKLLGVLVTMQSEREQGGKELGEPDVDRIYKELGVARKSAKNEKLLAELIEMVGGQPAPIKKLDLQEYGIGVGGSPAQQQQQQHQDSPYYGASSSRGPPPPGYGGSPRDARPPPTGIPGIDAGDIELLRNLRSTLKLMQNIAPASGPRSLPMPPGYGRPPQDAGYGRPPSEAGYGRPPSEAGYGRPPPEQGFGRSPADYDRRGEQYPPSSGAYPPYRSPADEEARLRRPPAPYDDPRERYADPRADPRMRDRYGAPPPTDPRYPPQRGYYDDPYERGPPPGYGGAAASPYDRDPRMRDPREAPPRKPPGLYDPPQKRVERPVLTREEYEARLRGEEYVPPPASQASSAPKPAAPTAPVAASAPAKKPQAAVIDDDDDDWGSLEQILDNKAAAAANAPRAAANRQPQPGAAQNGAQQSPAAGVAAELTPEEAKKLATKERQKLWRQQWGVKNKAAPAPQPHLAAGGSGLLQQPERVGFKQPPSVAAAAAHQQQQQPQMPPLHLGEQQGGQWDTQYHPPQRPQQHHYQQQQQQQQHPNQQYYDQYYGQTSGGYNNGNNGNYGGGRGGGYY